MELTIAEIMELAKFAGMNIVDDISEDDKEMPITISEKDGKKYAWYTEYPDEGSYLLTE